jgi:hypothetical protein
MIKISATMKHLIILAATLAALLVTHISVAQTANSRGVIREKEACETLALQVAVNPRASGSGISSNEAIAFNIAKLQARNELAAQVATEITSVLLHHAEQWQTANNSRTLSATLEHDNMKIVQCVSQILTNTRPICQNTYERPDGSVQVYVCLEMDLTAQRKSYKELDEAGILEIDVNGDGQNDVDFAEKEFLIELAKAREEYNNNKIREI